jgi:hypothetical protein
MSKKDNITEYFEYYYDDPDFDDAVLKEIKSHLLVGTVGLILGGIWSRLHSKYRDKALTCRDVSDKQERIKCMMNIQQGMINSLIGEMSSCENTNDPMFCKSELYKKIDKLQEKKNTLQRQLLDLSRSN